MCSAFDKTPSSFDFPATTSATTTPSEDYSSIAAFEDVGHFLQRVAHGFGVAEVDGHSYEDENDAVDGVVFPCNGSESDRIDEDVEEDRRLGAE